MKKVEIYVELFDIHFSKQIKDDPKSNKSAVLHDISSNLEEI